MTRRQNPKIERTLKRTSSLRLVKQTFLIVCEGEVTEPEYFNSFRLTSANVKAIGKGMNTISLVKEAIAIRDIEKNNLYQGSIHRSRYGEMLSHLLGFRYGKTKGDSMKVFNVIYPKTRIAIGNAQKVLESFDGSNPAKEESSTTVHQLVEQLLQFIE